MNDEQGTLMANLGHNPRLHTPGEGEVALRLQQAFEASGLPVAQRLANFPRHVRRQDMSRFLTKYELFKLALPAHGSVVECGVFAGGGLFGWLHFSAILEPYNHTRRIIGFDTFAGFPEVGQVDLPEQGSGHHQKGDFDTGTDIPRELAALAGIHDLNRPLGHVPKIELVPGDACQTLPEYVRQHPHLLVSLLYLDFDLYEPTKVALDSLYPRVVKGGVVAFDEVNCPNFPGETIALLERLSDTQALRRFPTDPYISYFVKA